MRWRRPSGLLLLALVLAGLLGLLATLQWQWLGQISAAERGRMHHTLRRQANEFAEDFDREITRAYFWFQMEHVWFQVDRLAGRSTRAAAPAKLYEGWFRTSPYPGLIKTIYQVTRDSADNLHSLRLARYDRQDATFVSLETWPRELEALQARLSAAALLEPPGDDVNDRAGRTGHVVPSIPAIVIPRPPFEIRRAPGAGPASGLEVTIAVLDMEYIKRELLPALAERHFTNDLTTRSETTTPAPGHRFEYRVAVIDRLTQTLIYCSAEDRALCRFDEPDYAEDMLEVRVRDFNRFVVDNRLRPPLPPGEHSAYKLSLMRRRSPGHGPEVRPRADGPWQVALRHQSGSLEIAVAQARQRNLFVSFGVLLLLATSIGLVLISTGRARYLAARQLEFVAGVSHELRTPLAVIRSAAENLADGVVAEAEQVRRYGTLIASEGRRLTQMVEQVMEFAGIATGRRQLDLRPVDVQAVIDDALAACQPLAREQGCRIDVDLPSELPTVIADAEALSRSVQNLLSNAIKYGSSGAWVGLTAEVGNHGRPEVRVNVTDRGPGIAAEDLPHIFEPFYRGRGVENGRVHGSGLGLSLVARIMEQHRGKVTVRSEPHNATTFTLHVPAA
ncbi:MAG: sensor histidine kinase [Vicinamibacteraceae bacterium]